MENNSSKLSKIIIALSAVIAAISLYILIAIELPDKPLAGQGGAPNDEVLIGGDFTLTDHNGNEFSSDMMKGKMSLVYFGFTFCPDICPTSLQKLTNVLTTLDKYQIDVLQVLMKVNIIIKYVFIILYIFEKKIGTYNLLLLENHSYRY